MRLGIFVGVAVLALITLVSAFPRVVAAPDSSGGNIADHMTFTREIADNAAKLDALKSQHDAMASQFSAIPERMARIEERLDLLGRMVYAVLGGIFALLVKEVWMAMRVLRTHKGGNGNGITNNRE